MTRKATVAGAITTILAVAAGTCPAAENNATVLQGGVARWSSNAAAECGIFGRRFGAIDGVCYYPVDMKAKPGVHEIAMWDAAGARTLGTLTVVKRVCTQTEIALDDDTYVKISEANKQRGVEERARIVKAVAGADAEPGFALPLGAPAEGVATRDRSDFCELRLYDGGLVKSRHTGLDYPLAKGTRVVASADGTVSLSEEQFYTGKTVVVDHGGGLVTMVFHLDEIAVEAGSRVKRGDSLGTVGSTGRSTGAHLHYGARYQDQRIDAGTLIGDPSKLPGVGEAVGSTVDDTAAIDTDAALPTTDNKAGEDISPAASAAATSDAAATDAQSAAHAGDPESAHAVEKKEDAIQAEKAAQQKADEAAKSR